MTTEDPNELVFLEEEPIVVTVELLAFLRDRMAQPWQPDWHHLYDWVDNEKEIGDLGTARDQ